MVPPGEAWVSAPPPGASPWSRARAAPAGRAALGPSRGGVAPVWLRSPTPALSEGRKKSNKGFLMKTRPEEDVRTEERRGQLHQGGFSRPQLLSLHRGLGGAGAGLPRRKGAWRGATAGDLSSPACVT